MVDTFIPAPVPNSPIQLGYVILNPKLGREEYISKCLKTHTVDVVLSNGTYYEECPVSVFEGTSVDGTYSTLNFPKEKKKLGTTVVLAFAFGSRKPIVMSFLPNTENKMQTQNEGQSKSTQSFEDCSVIVSKDPKTGVVDIAITKNKKAKINIMAFSPDEESELNLQTNGKVNTIAKEISMKAYSKFSLTLQDKKKQDKITTLTTELGVGTTITDEFENSVTLDATGVKVATKKDIDLTAEGNVKATIKGNLEAISAEAKVEADKVELKSKDIKIDGVKVVVTGGTLTVDGAAAPTGSGPFCALPNCVFSGAPHTGNKVTGT